MSKREEREQNRQAQDELEALLREHTPGGDELQAMMDGVRLLPERQQVYTDFKKMLEETKGEAERTVTAVVDFYLDADAVANDYIVEISRTHALNLANFKFQLESTQFAVIKLMEEIDAGNTHPRAFEVLASLQKVLNDIGARLSAFMVVMENHYKSLHADISAKVHGAAEAAVDDGPPQQLNGRVYKGSLKLMEELERMDDNSDGLDAAEIGPDAV